MLIDLSKGLRKADWKRLRMDLGLELSRAACWIVGLKWWDQQVYILVLRVW